MRKAYIVKFAIVLLGAAALFFSDVSTSETQAFGHRHRNRNTCSQGGSYGYGGYSGVGYASAGRGYSGYSSGYSGMGAYNAGGYGGGYYGNGGGYGGGYYGNGGGWGGVRNGGYMNGGNFGMYGSPRIW